MKMTMRCRLITLVLAASLGGCASIPPEAPELSAQLGSRITAMEAAHSHLVQQFFQAKKRRVDEFVQEVWVPVFTQEFFKDPKVDAVWKQVVQSQDDNDRQKFTKLVSTRLQEKINQKRLELIQPLDDLESAIQRKLKSEYDQSRAINNTITAFLHSSAKIEENRKRYLDIVGFPNKEMDKFVNEADQAVTELTSTDKGVSDLIKDARTDAEKYRNRVNAILNKLGN